MRDGERERERGERERERGEREGGREGVLKGFTPTHLHQQQHIQL